MKSILRIGCLVAAGAMLALTAAPTYAQRGGGMGRGLGGTSRAQLATLKEVQDELHMSDEQKKAATEAVEKMNTARRELFSAGPGGDPAEMREKMTKLTSEADAAVTAKLDEAGKKRLMEIFVQVNKTAALADAEVQKALGLDEATVKKLADARAQNMEAMMAAGQELQGLSQEERQEKMATLRKTADEKIFSAISAEQKAAFEKLGGAELKVDLTPLQPRRGPGGPGGGGRPAP
jgi:hypothetical protein